MKTVTLDLVFFQGTSDYMLDTMDPPNCGKESLAGFYGCLLRSWNKFSEIILVSTVAQDKDLIFFLFV